MGRIMTMEFSRRGLLAGDNVWWPTRNTILVFRQRTERGQGGGSPIAVRELDLKQRGAIGGNLLIHDRVLLIASPDKLFAFDER